MTLPESLDARVKEKKSNIAPPILVADADVRAEAQEALATAAKTFSIKVLTVNIHKGFTFFNRKFILPELREAVRKIGADVVFLQEVTGSHTHHGDKFDNYPDTPHYEFLADSIWPEFAIIEYSATCAAIAAAPRNMMPAPTTLSLEPVLPNDQPLPNGRGKFPALSADATPVWST